MELLQNIMARPLTIPSSLDISPGCKSIMKMLLKVSSGSNSCSLFDFNALVAELMMSERLCLHDFLVT